MTGGKGKDAFIFEANQTANGTDLLLDFIPLKSSRPKAKGRREPDILDLSLALADVKRLKNRNLSQYVWVEDENLYVDPAGKRTPGRSWATLKGVVEGDVLLVRIGRFNGQITVGKSAVDSSKPSFDPNGNYSYTYDENQLINAVVAAVSGAQDDKGVTQYRFYDPSNPDGAAAESPDSYFKIDSSGKISITQKGWAATVNEYDDGTISFDYYVQAGDQEGNWSDAQKITLNLKDLDSGSGSTIYLTLDRTGAWYDTNKDGKRDAGETAATLIASGDLWQVKDVNTEVDNVTLRVVDLKVSTALDLRGFGSGDKLVMDYNTNKNSWFDYGQTAWWNPSEKPTFDPANYNKNFDSQILIMTFRTFWGNTAALYSGARYTYNEPTYAYVSYSQNAGHVIKGSTALFGNFRHYFDAKPYSSFSGKASVTQLIPNWNAIVQSPTLKGFVSTATVFSDVLSKGLGGGYTVEIIKPTF